MWLVLGGASTQGGGDVCSRGGNYALIDAHVNCRRVTRDDERPEEEGILMGGSERVEGRQQGFRFIPRTEQGRLSRRVPVKTTFISHPD